MMEQYNFSSQILGPFKVNQTVVCFNSSLLPEFGWKDNPTVHLALLQAAVTCPPFPEEEISMEKSLSYFWNATFTVMIIAAILGNMSVLWIVIRKTKLPILLVILENFRPVITFSLVCVHKHMQCMI